MFRSLSDRASALVFIALVLAIAAATATIAGGLLLALSPLLVTALMMLVVTRDGYRKEGWRRLGLTRAGLRWWPAALIATAGVSTLAAVATLALGVSHATAPTATSWQDLLSLCMTGPILAFAEEIGWRGYLQPRLQSGMGEARAFLVVGIVWVAWHLIYILLTPFYHAEGNRWIVLPLFSATVISFSFLFGLLRSRSGSVWPVVLAHFAHNAAFAWIGSALIVADDRVVAEEYLAGDTGLLVLVGSVVAAVAIALARRPAIGDRTR